MVNLQVSGLLGMDCTWDGRRTSFLTKHVKSLMIKKKLFFKIMKMSQLCNFGTAVIEQTLILVKKSSNRANPYNQGVESVVLAIRKEIRA